MCSNMVIYQVPHTRQIAINGSCASRGGQIFENIYEWNTVKGNWCLIREIRCEQQDIEAEHISPSITVSRTIGCTDPGDLNPPAYEDISLVKTAIRDTLGSFSASASSDTAFRSHLERLPYYDIAELVAYIDEKNVREVNDLAFHLYQYDRTDEAITLLEKIVAAFPARIVAQLNLADAYWKTDQRSRARRLYQQYYEVMSTTGREKRIPKRVHDRRR